MGVVIILRHTLFVQCCRQINLLCVCHSYLPSDIHKPSSLGGISCLLGKMKTMCVRVWLIVLFGGFLWGEAEVLR